MRPLTAAETVTEIREGRMTARESVSAALQKAVALDPRINAFSVIRTEEALEEADAIDAGGAGSDGPLAGVPVAVKEEYDVAGLVTTLGGLGNSTPAASDSEAIRRLRAAGAVIIGKTTMPEFGQIPLTESETTGLTRNPWNLDHGPGGSSGGSGAAVAAGIVPIALGGDGGGSIRIPASACGLVGLKPTRGRISLAPLAQHWFGLVVLGGLTRTVRDTAILLDVLSGSLSSDRWQLPDPEQPFVTAAERDPGLLRIGWTTKPVQPGVRTPRDVVRATATMMSNLALLGHDVREGSPHFPILHDAFLPQFFAGMRVEAGLVEHPDLLERRTKDIVGLSGWVTNAILDRALRRGEEIAEAVDAYVLGSADIVAYPVMPALVPKAGVASGQGGIRSMLTSLPYVTNTSLANVTGHPSIALPAGLDSNGVPIGVQLMARRGREDLLLSVAAQVEGLQPGGAWPLSPMASGSEHG